jgi:Holliday junction resolvasome RuvABC ATP-dependent DNA helicase subunit
VDAAMPHGRDRAAHVLIAPLGHRAAVSHTFATMQRARAGLPRRSVHVPQRGVPVLRDALKRNCNTAGPTPNSPLPFSFHEVKYSIEEMIEPYLMQIGFLNRTPRRRMATRRAYEHFGLNLSGSSEPTLFE